MFIFPSKISSAVIGMVYSCLSHTNKFDESLTWKYEGEYPTVGLGSTGMCGESGVQISKVENMGAE